MQRFIFFFIPVFLFLAGCAETQLVAHAVKNIPWGSQSKGTFKVGNPYVIDGKRYTPRETYNFTETGIASWYGPQFHGKKTANGEIFDMNELTAAHRTLQIPSLVRVTNLENGRSLIVRVNDRGPFKRSRVIDLSRRSAELLGYKDKGTAKVRLEVLGPESMKIAQAAKNGHDTSGVEIAMNERQQHSAFEAPEPLTMQDTTDFPSAPGRGAFQLAAEQTETTEFLPASAAPAPVQKQELPVRTVPGHNRAGNFYPDPVIQEAPVKPAHIYVQVASFGSQDKAARYAEQLATYGKAKVYPAVVNGKQYYRVRLGPVADVDNADLLLGKLAATHNTQAIIMVE